MIILGVDLGKSRTGIAACDRQEILASPVTVIEEKSRELLCEKICAIAAERKAELIVMGLPKNMDGSEGASAQAAREFAARLAEASGLSVELSDERGTTITAHSYLNEVNVRGSKRKSAVDAVAAVIILEEFMRKRKLSGAE